MAMLIECDVCGDEAGEEWDFYIVRSFRVTLGDRIPVYANSCDEVIMCHKCWKRIVRQEKDCCELKVVE